MLNHLDAGRVFADRDLVKSMVGNLSCISYRGAKEIYDCLADRAANADQSPLNVQQSAVVKVLKLLPPMPATPRGGEYRYRAPSEAIQAAWTVLDTSTTATLNSLNGQQ